MFVHVCVCVCVCASVVCIMHTASVCFSNCIRHTHSQKLHLQSIINAAGLIVYIRNFIVKED